MSPIRAIPTILALAAIGLCVPTQPTFAAVLIPISSVTANAPNNLNTPSVIVSDAQGDYNYAAPPPGGGGGGTSWHTNQQGGPTFAPIHNVRVTFNFSSTSAVDELVLWDYYAHSPTLWTVKLFSGLSAAGVELLTHDFSISPQSSFFSTRWVIDLADTLNVNSAQLLTRNTSGSGGVGLSEVAFVAAVPQPTSGAVFMVGFVAVALCTWFRRRCSISVAC